MSEEFKEFSEAPKLVIDGYEDASYVEAPSLSPVEDKAPQWNDDILSDDEKKLVKEFVDQIDLHNSNVILQYGAGAQKKMASFSEEALANVRTKDLGEIGNLLSNVLVELKSFDAEDEKGFFGGLFKKSSAKVAAMMTKYERSEVTIQKISKNLEGHQVVLLKDIAILDKMYEQNLAYFKELTMYILAGKEKLHRVQTIDLKELKEKAQRTGLPEDAQAARDLDALCNRFEKKIHDLELTKMIAIQTAPQIRLVQGNDTLMVEKIQSTLVNTIPLWKSQMVLALGVEHSAQAARAQREVTDMTNKLLRKNAETLKMATVETARESERGIVDMETLQATNQNLIDTLDEVLQIQREGKIKREEASREILRLESELKQKLLQIAE